MIYSSISLFSLCCSFLLVGQASCQAGGLQRFQLPATAPKAGYPSLSDATAADLVQGLGNKTFSSIDLVEAYIIRISEVNDTLRAVTELNPDALAIAAELDQERANGKIRGPLHGLPMLIKNNIATYDEMNNTAGSFALLGATVPRDAGVIKKLRDAGVILLGKSNLSQWANYRSGNSSNGWSAYGGQVEGIYLKGQDPSGSSSGSAVATSLGLCFAALGTETSGSLVEPGQRSNLVAIKPTVGLTSRDLVVPISERQDTVGPLARSVKDAAAVLQVIAGVDQNDNYTSAIPNNGTIPDYVAACNTSSFQGKRIGIPRNMITPAEPSDPVASAFADAIKTITDLGATVVDNADITEFAINVMAGKTPDIVLGADFVSGLPLHYLSKLSTNPNNVTSLPDVEAFTKATPAEDYPDRDVSVWDAALALGYNNTDPRFWAAYQTNLLAGGSQGILGALQNHSLDALILPTSDAYQMAAIIGSPVITVPLGFYPTNQTVVKNFPRADLIETGPNVPFGLSFLGPKWSEAALIGFAYAYEQQTDIRSQATPYITPSYDLGDNTTATS